MHIHTHIVAEAPKLFYIAVFLQKHNSVHVVGAVHVRYLAWLLGWGVDMLMGFARA